MRGKNCVSSVVLALALVAAPALAGPTITIQPAAQAIPVGGTHVFDVVASNVSPQIISTYDFDFGFDPSKVAFVSAAGEQGLGSPSIFGTLPGLGSVELFEVSLLSDANLATLQGTAPFTLASVTLQGIAEGLSGLSLTFHALGGAADPAGNPTDLLALQPTLVGAQLTVTAPVVGVPEPASALLAGLALSLLLVTRGRARS